MFKDKKILIVGATGSLGKAISEALAKEGADLILLGRSAAKLEKLDDHLSSTYGVKPNLMPIQLANAEAEVYMQLSQAIHEQYGELNGFIFCPAHLSGFTPIEHFSPAEWYESIQVNLNSAFLLTKTLLPFLKKQTKPLRFMWQRLRDKRAGPIAALMRPVKQGLSPLQSLWRMNAKQTHTFAYMQ